MRPLKISAHAPTHELGVDELLLMNICDFPGCSASFNKLWRLKEHQCSAHTGERPHVCSHPGCDKAFIRAYHLKRHLLTHSDTKEEHECPHPGCERVYCSTQSLRKHTKTHTTPKPHSCQDCGASFKKHTQLAVHRAEHTGSLPFQCEAQDCGAHFKTPSALRKHQKTHKGYVCPVEECRAVFAKWSDLRRHAPTHPKVCEVCRETFTRARQLKLHMMATHSPSRQVLSCPKEGCKRFYTTPYNLQQHIASFHKKERPFKCNQSDCSASFSTKQSMVRHYSRVHSGSKEPSQKQERPKRTLISRISGHIVRKSEILCGEGEEMERE